VTRITAVFDEQDQAERAITELRNVGVTDAELSVVSRHEPAGVGAAEGVGKGALAGAGVGLSVFNGALRFDLSHPLTPDTGGKVRFDIVVQAAR